MPFPLLLLAGAGMAGVNGLSKLARGVGHLGDARTIGERGNRLADATRLCQEQKDQRFKVAADAFAQHRQQVQFTSLVRFAKLYERQIEALNLTDKEFSVRFHVSEAELKEVKTTTKLVLSLVSTALSAGSLGMGVVGGAGSVIGTLGGLASTGTAIGTLGGAAATNATLAWLGGGSLVTGGGGMAMGTLVLGGLAAAPALIVAGYTVAKKGEQALTAAVQFEADVQRFRAETRLRATLQDAAERRMDELQDVLERTRQRLDQAVLICEEQERHGPVSDLHFDAALQLAQGVSALIKINVLEPPEKVEVQEGDHRVLENPLQPVAPGTPLPVDWQHEVAVVELADEWTNSAFVDQDDLLVANIGGRILMWSFAEPDPEPLELDLDVGTVKHLQAHPTDDLFIGARGRQGPLMFGGLRSEEWEADELDMDDMSVVSTHFLSDDEMVIVAEDQVLLLDLETGDMRWQWKTPASSVRAAAIHPEGRLIALGSTENEIHVVELSTGKLVKKLQHAFWCNALAFSPDGRHLLSASEDKTAKQWAVDSWREVRRFEFGGRYADRVAFSPDGDVLAVGFANGVVGVWNTETGDLLNLFAGGKGRPTTLQFTAGGEGLVVAGEGGLRLCVPGESAEKATSKMN